MGQLRVWSIEGSSKISVVGLSNRFWNIMIPEETGILTAAECFSDLNSIAIRVRPGATEDVRFEEPVFLPGWETKKEKLEDPQFGREIVRSYREYYMQPEIYGEEFAMCNYHLRHYSPPPGTTLTTLTLVSKEPCIYCDQYKIERRV